MFSKKEKEQDEVLDTIDIEDTEITEEEFLKDEADTENMIDGPDEPEAPLKPKKKLPAWVILPVIAVIAIGSFAVSKLTSNDNKAQGTTLQVTAVKTSDIKEVYNASGKIESENTKTYYSPVTAPISKCNAVVGNTVKAGDLLVTFDTTNLERDNQQAQLSLQASLNSSQVTKAQNAKAIDAANSTSAQAADQANALANKVNELAAQVDAAYNQYQENLRKAEAEAPEQAEIAQKIAALQDTINKNQEIITETESNYMGRRADLDTANAKAEKNEEDNAVIAALGPIFDKYDEAVAAVKKSQIDMAELQSKVSAGVDDAGYPGLKGAYDELYAQWEAAYNAANASSPNAGMTSAELNALEISDNLAELTALTPAELVAKGQEGMKADMNGVIASVDAMQTNTATQGMLMFTIATTDNVRVKIEVSPDDYDKLKVGNEATITVGDYKYKGKLSKVNKIAVNNEKGNPVIGAQIHIENPDANLCIGATAKVTMTVAESKGVLSVPTEVINTSSDGDFVYVIKDGVVAKKPVELGTASTTQVEVKSGLEKGDQVVNDLNVDITEGMKATGLSTDTADQK